MSILNRIAARLIDAALARVTMYPTDKLDEFPNKPWVWGHVICDEADGSPYLTRVLFPRVPANVPFVGNVRPMIHKFHRPDVDRHLHNHPWLWALSIVLAGAYTEERCDVDASNLARRVVVEPRVVTWWNWIVEHDWHRIDELHGAVYTLFIVGPKLNRPDEKRFEFLDVRTARRIPWRQFLDAKKRARRAALPTTTPAE